MKIKRKEESKSAGRGGGCTNFLQTRTPKARMGMKIDLGESIELRKSAETGLFPK